MEPSLFSSSGELPLGKLVVDGTILVVRSIKGLLPNAAKKFNPEIIVLPVSAERQKGWPISGYARWSGKPRATPGQ